MIRFLIFAAAMTAFYLPLALGQVTLLDPRELTFDKNGTFAPFKAKRARALMSDAEFLEYTAKLAKLNCRDAGKLLNQAFIREYPEFKRGQMKPKCNKDRDCRYWNNYAHLTYLEYGYCTNVVKWNDVENEIHRKNITLPKFKLKRWRERTLYDNPWMERRDRTVALLIGMGQSDYLPALVKLASLVRRGDVFNADEETEYYILKRACLLGPDCERIAPRLKALRPAIALERIAQIENKANADPGKQPLLRNLLLGEKL